MKATLYEKFAEIIITVLKENFNKKIIRKIIIRKFSEDKINEMKIT